MTEIKFNQESLESLLISIIRLKDINGNAVQVNASDILLPHVIEQIPKPLVS